MKVCVHGTGTLADLFGDAVVYRRLEPADPRLPGIGELRRRLGLEPDQLPRKAEPDYGRVVAEMLRSSAEASTGDRTIEHVVLIGDTELNDGGAFENICAALDCPGAAFICSETDEVERLTDEDLGDGRVLSRGNRWAKLDAWAGELARRHIVVGPATAVLVDIDKTALGARGRNHRPIDAARIAAVTRTAAELRGDGLDRERLMAAYERFNQPRFHPFTGDNQDYLAYIAMLVESGWIGADDLEARVAFGDVVTFPDLLDRVSAEVVRLPKGLRRAHDDVLRATAAGDPTPFKTFRSAEFVETVRRMTPPSAASDVRELLADRLTITAEVWRSVSSWRECGAQLLALSDKPDEASTPTAELAAEGYLPLHRTEALIVGEGPGPGQT